MSKALTIYELKQDIAIRQAFVDGAPMGVRRTDGTWADVNPIGRSHFFEGEEYRITPSIHEPIRLWANVYENGGVFGHTSQARAAAVGESKKRKRLRTAVPLMEVAEALKEIRKLQERQEEELASQRKEDWRLRELQENELASQRKEDWRLRELIGEVNDILNNKER